MMEGIEFGAGCHISTAAQVLVDAAEQHGTAVGSFNDIELIAERGTTADEIVRYFAAEQERRSQAYRNSAAGKAAEAEREQRRRDSQATHDRLMAELPRLNMRDADAVLAWLGHMQGPSDLRGVIVRRETILSAFAAAGYLPGVNCGADYRADDRDNALRYLVGQALSGLHEGPAIHPIFHKFADEWRARFMSAPALIGDQQT